MEIHKSLVYGVSWRSAPLCPHEKTGTVAGHLKLDA